MSQLTIKVAGKQHQDIKEYAIQHLFSFTPDEKHSILELRALLNQRITSALNGEVSSKSMREIAEEMMQSK